MLIYQEILVQVVGQALSKGTLVTLHIQGLLHSSCRFAHPAAHKAASHLEAVALQVEEGFALTVI